MEITTDLSIADQERWLGFCFFEAEIEWGVRIRALSKECLGRQARLHQLLKSAIDEYWIADCNQYATVLYRDHALLVHRQYMRALAAEIEIQEALYKQLSLYRADWHDEEMEALEEHLDQVFDALLATRMATSQLFSLNKRNALLNENSWGLEVDVHLQEQFEHQLLVLGSGRRQQKPRRPARNKRIDSQAKTKKTKLELA